MSRFNLQSLGFAALVLVLVLLGKRGDSGGEVPITSAIEATSFTAQTIEIKEPEIETPPAATGNPLASVAPRERLVFMLHADEGTVKEKAPLLHANSAAVSELGGGHRLLFSKGYRNRWPIASITKLMTAVIVTDELDSASTVTVSERAAGEFGDGGTFRPGEIFTVADLLKAMLVGSSNDAAVALAERVGYERFMDAMRQKAFTLGMHETAFADPTGISVLNQSTAEDLTILAGFLARTHRALLDLTTLRSVEITERGSGNVRTIRATNLFAGMSDFVGGKTGYTTDANGNLLSIFTRAGREFLVVTLGTDDRFGDTEALWRWVQKTE